MRRAAAQTTPKQGRANRQGRSIGGPAVGELVEAYFEAAAQRPRPMKSLPLLKAVWRNWSSEAKADGRAIEEFAAAELTAAKIRHWSDGIIGRRGPNGRKGTALTATKLIKILSAALHFSDKAGVIDLENGSPTARVTRAESEPRNNPIPASLLPMVLQGLLSRLAEASALPSGEAKRRAAFPPAILLLLLLLARRKEEIRGLRWSQVYQERFASSDPGRLEEALVFHWETTKNGAAFALPVLGLALRAFEAVKTCAVRSSNGESYIFRVGSDVNRPLSDYALRSYWDRFQIEILGLKEPRYTLHDLRRTNSEILSNIAGFSEEDIEAMLHHLIKKVNRPYIHIRLPRLFRIYQAANSFFEAFMTPAGEKKESMGEVERQLLKEETPPKKLSKNATLEPSTSQRRERTKEKKRLEYQEVTCRKKRS